MQDHVQLRFKAKEAMAIASTRENAGKFEEASAAYTLAADICAKAKTLAIAAGADAKAMRDAEVREPKFRRQRFSFAAHVISHSIHVTCDV